MELNYKKILNWLLITVGVVAGAYFTFMISLYFIPFIVAFIISTLLDPIIVYFMKKLKFSRKASAIIIVTVMMSTIGVLLFFMVVKLTSELITFSYALPDFFSGVYGNVKAMIDKATEIYLGWPVEITSNISNILSSISNTLLKFANTATKGILSLVTSIPNAFLFVIVTILSIYFFSIDKDSINGFFRNKLPSSWAKRISGVRSDMFSALLGYIKSQLIMMIITFVQLLIGFAIIGVKPALLLALLLSVIDALPLVGLGTVIIPWAIYDMFTNNFNAAVSILILYVIIVIVRQIVEPRILSQQIGIHPILTLMAMGIL